MRRQEAPRAVDGALEGSHGVRGSAGGHLGGSGRQVRAKLTAGAFARAVPAHAPENAQYLRKRAAKPKTPGDGPRWIRDDAEGPGQLRLLLVSAALLEVRWGHNEGSPTY